MPSYNDHAVDPTILKHTTGRLYLAFSGNTPNLGQGIYMALMDDPTSVVPDTQTLIHSPSLDWEGQVNQGPSFVENAGSYFLIYSVGYTFNQDYRLREMSIYNDLDPLQISNWWLGDDESVFWKNEEEGVFATGHSGFVKSPGTFTLSTKPEKSI
jgi:GH43 family beta-xylosidase